MTEHTDSDFKEAIDYSASEEKEIDKYLILKGPDRYFEILEIYQRKVKDHRPTWREISSFYRYDKRICFLLLRYFSMFEEYLRALLLKNASHLQPGSYAPNEKGKFEAFYCKLSNTAKRHQSETFYGCLELTHFSTLVDLYLLLPTCYSHFLANILSSSRTVLVALRNAVAHGRFLFGSDYDGKPLDKAIELFGNSLPRDFGLGDFDHSGFFSELRAAGRDFDDINTFVLNPHLGDVGSLTPPRSVTMFNAGFGDCFLIKDGFSDLVVDCGTINAMFPSQPALAKKLHSMLIDSPDLLITHFHADHMNGLVPLVSSFPQSQRFQTVYVRGLSKTDYSFWVRAYQASLTTLLATTLDADEFSALMNIPGTLIGLCKPNGRVRTLAEGSLFSVGTTPCQVLWPTRDCLLNCNTKSAQKMKKATKDFFDGLAAIAQSDDGLYGLIENLDSFSRENDSRNFSSLFDDDGEGTSPERLATMSQESAVTCKRISDVVLHSPKIQKYLVSQAKKMAKIGTDLENYLSIIFSSSDNFYFAGDGKKNIVKKTLKKAGGAYSLIKVPHHGTTNYYVDFSPYSFPSKTLLLIPNALLNKKWRIDNRYLNGFCECLNSAPGFTACPKANTCRKKTMMKGYQTYRY